MEEKTLKLKLSLKHKLSSLQLCRPKNPSNHALNPAKYSMSLLKSKTFDISYPSFSLPSPPPTTPETSSLNRCPHLPKHPKPRISRKSEECSEYPWSKDGRIWHMDRSSNSCRRTCFKSNLGNCNSRKIMSSDSGWSSSDSDDDGIFTERDTDTLLCTSMSFSNDTFSELGSSQKSENKNKGKATVRNSRSYSKPVLCGDKETMVSSPSVMRRILPQSTAAEGKAAKSVAVVKESENPLEDFKASMMEMVLENQMFEAKELEELLRCFLSLNTREYHGVIVEAFAELWQTLFYEFSPVKRRVS